MGRFPLLALAFIILSLISLSAQECDISQLVMPPIFEDSAIGYGWGPFYQGIVIDSEGNVFSFNNPDYYNPLQPEIKTELTSANLEKRYGKRIKLVRKLLPEVLAEIKQLIPEVFPQRELASLSGIVEDWEPNIQMVFKTDEASGKIERANIGTSIDKRVVIIDLPAARRIIELTREPK